MVIDSPFHNISQKTRNAFVDLVTQIAPGMQTTFFVTDGEYTATVKEKIKGPPINSIRDHLLENNTLWREYLLDVVCDECGELVEGHPHQEEDENFDHKPISCTKITEVKSD